MTEKPQQIRAPRSKHVRERSDLNPSVSISTPGVLPPSMSGRAEGAIVVGLAHDMRSMLATIAAAAGLFERGLPADEVRYLRETIARQVTRLDGIAETLADYAALATGQINLTLRTVDICQLIREAVQDLRLSEARSVFFALPSAELSIQADEAKVRRILDNLLSNAFKYSHTSGSVVVRAASAVSGDEVVIEVENEGRSIPRGSRRKIFELYARQDDDTEGNGVGLFVVKMLAEAHGGRAWVEEGTSGPRFCVAMPSSPALGQTILDTS